MFGLEFFFIFIFDKHMNAKVTDSRTERNVKLHSVTHFYRKYLCLVQGFFNDKLFYFKIGFNLLRMRYTKNRRNLTFFFLIEGVCN